ncbi:MAG: hypothetical protein IPK07_24195 [Deltaproteobacteria bacterium]|nr:hypothetical protein [Deltaproteobacteria bacterium]
MDDRSLPSALVEEIARFGFEPPVVRETRHSEVDGAVKLLVALPRPSSEPERAADAEAVLIPEAARA